MSDLAIQLSESGRDWLIHRPVDIAIYVVLALAVRYVLHRAIDRLVQGAGGRNLQNIPDGSGGRSCVADVIWGE